MKFKCSYNFGLHKSFFYIQLVDLQKKRAKKIYSKFRISELSAVWEKKIVCHSVIFTNFNISEVSSVLVKNVEIHLVTHSVFNLRFKVYFLVKQHLGPNLFKHEIQYIREQIV